MNTNIRERARSEGGFTLIELLVVMIIIAILMAVAIPTFLAQKNTAQKTKAIANIKQVVNTVESCAANNTDGSYTGCTTLGAGAGTAPAGSLKAFERGIINLYGGTGVTHFTVLPIGAVPSQGYQVATSIKDGNATVWFLERHAEDGTVSKLCGSGATSAATITATGSAVAGSRTCTNGKWG